LPKYIDIENTFLTNANQSSQILKNISVDNFIGLTNKLIESIQSVLTEFESMYLLELNLIDIWQNKSKSLRKSTDLLSKRKKSTINDNTIWIETLVYILDDSD